MGDEKSKTETDPETGIDDQTVDLVIRVSRVAVKRLCEAGISPDELIFIPKEGKDPVLNPILAALSLEFLQFEEFQIPENNKLYLAEERENLPIRIKDFDSKCELAVSKVLASPWASISTIRGREISSVIITETLSDSHGIILDRDLRDSDISYSWTYSISGGYGSSQELFEPVSTAISVFSSKIRGVDGEIESFNVIPINNIPEREVGWKIVIKLKG